MENSIQHNIVEAIIFYLNPNETGSSLGKERVRVPITSEDSILVKFLQNLNNYACINAEVTLLYFD